MNLQCRCNGDCLSWMKDLGFAGCNNEATQEDGYCNLCRENMKENVNEPAQ